MFKSLDGKGEMFKSLDGEGEMLDCDVMEPHTNTNQSELTSPKLCPFIVTVENHIWRHFKGNYFIDSV